MATNQTGGTVRSNEDGQLYPFDRGSNYTVNFDMLHIGMRVTFSLVTYGETVTAQNLAML